jgi:hypothetical protein
MATPFINIPTVPTLITPTVPTLITPTVPTLIAPTVPNIIAPTIPNLVTPTVPIIPERANIIAREEIPVPMVPKIIPPQLNIQSPQVGLPIEITKTGPTIIAKEETGYNILQRTMNIWNGTREQIVQLSNLRYIGDGTLIVDPRRKNIIMELIGMLRANPYDEVVEFLSHASDHDFILWEQPSLDEGRNKLIREIIIRTAEDEGIEGIDKCRYCPSTRLVYATVQLRSGDEPKTVFVRCVECKKQWKQA